MKLSTMQRIFSWLIRCGYKKQGNMFQGNSSSNNYFLGQL